MNYNLIKDYQDIANRTLIIYGCARSGTSILGNIVGSMQKAEYLFESPSLTALFAEIDNMPKRTAKNLFEMLVIEDFLLYSLSGRNMNMRRADDSSIFKTKPEDEINRRLSLDNLKRDISIKDYFVVAKIVSFCNHIKKIQETFELSFPIYIYRNPENVIFSIKKKEWFTDRSISSGVLDWPNNFDFEIPIPHWVPSEYFSEWSEMSEVDRIGLYYITQTSLELNHIKNLYVINYDDFLENTNDIIDNLVLNFELKPTKLTDNLCKQVRAQKSSSSIDLGKIREEFREKIVENYNKLESFKS